MSESHQDQPDKPETPHLRASALKTGAKIAMMASLAAVGGELSAKPAQAMPEAAPQAAAKKPKAPETFPASHLKLSAEQIRRQQQSNLVLALKTELGNGSSTTYKCNAYKVIYKGNPNYALGAKHCAKDIISKSILPDSGTPNAVQNYQDAVPGESITLLSPADHTQELGSSAAIDVSGRDDLLLVKVNPGPGWEKLPGINLDKAPAKAKIGEPAYIFGTSEKNGYSKPTGVRAVYLGLVHDKGVNTSKALYEAYGVSGPAAKTACPAGESGTLAGTAEGHFSGGMWTSYNFDLQDLDPDQVFAPQSLVSQIENHNGISTAKFKRFCLFTPMRFDAYGTNLSLQELVAGETNTVDPPAVIPQ